MVEGAKPFLRRYSVSVVRTFASQQEVAGFNSRSGWFCEEFACSPCVSMGSSYSPKTVRLIGDSKVSVDGCLSALR